MAALTLAEPYVRVLTSFVKWNKALLALQQYLKDLRLNVLIKSLNVLVKTGKSFRYCWRILSMYTPSVYFGSEHKQISLGAEESL